MTASTDINGGQSSTPNEQTPGATVEPTTTATPPEEQVVADPAEAFAALGLGSDALRAIRELGFSEPTPIQQQTIPELLAGRDVIAQAPTGTGKTAAFGLPIVERLDVNQLAPQALIIVPTRELCIQVAEAMHGWANFARWSRCRSMAASRTSGSCGRWRAAYRWWSARRGACSTISTARRSTSAP